MLAYREYFKKERGITKPNLVMPDTAHPGFDKACFYLGMECRKVPVVQFKCDFEAIRKAVDANTICLVGSCPDYAYGLYDPMEKLALLA